ncbi:FAD-binding and (Fe-S)-binding domain-containing protein [Nocardioides marmoribigeumensis]|uniref:FAD/FMN-containing dehydrogenase/Fe-S oxidoreductase n=1 Tax=Nocardioides marmoribigeumensis TaxID=433649 RepID=A0ABU2BWC1_9ACTN|nr:FAD-binding and (Fe-S)-binding domain-containing protein [Nocardioides marmoribigeumensis]MDR7362932.1 FAD/FMN-containing dehydrogenase/Fe-S oxidoreductase [Nocardioides marmoribigeumensis]
MSLAPDPLAGDLVAALRAAGLADVDDSRLARTLYSSDASVYRLEPRVVVRPRHRDEIAATLAVARDLAVPLTARGAGTSIAGNAIGTGIVLDTYRHLNRVLAVDPEAAEAVVEPGAVHATLQRAAMSHGLRFGPDPSTHTRCTIGGMIGNNACGSRALGYGRTSDNVLGLSTLTADGAGVETRAADLAALVDQHLGLVRTEFGRFARQVSGYALEHLLPENGRSLDRFLVGSEGTLALVTEARVRLVRDLPVRVLVVLGYPSLAEGADHVPAILAHRPVACEGIDHRITDVLTTPPDLPGGRAWLMVELTGDDPREVADRAAAVVADSAPQDHRVVEDVAEQAAIWRVREDGAGLAARAVDPPGQPGWEDAAVLPERMGAYLRDFDALLESHGLQGAPYGHIGDGCLHIRVNFDLASAGGRVGYRRFVEEAADLAMGYGGSLSGEHGDGRARSELLTRMYSREALDLMAAVKHALDPGALLNPGVLVDPAPLDADLRLAHVPAHPPRTSLRLVADRGDLVAAVHRCTGVGKCLADGTANGGVMCPSFQATREEKDSTRGRARTLQDAVAGHLPGGLADPAVHEALDLCLACKGCASDCPTGVDMATYKSEVLHQTYSGKGRRRRPRTHYTLGGLPQLLSRVPTPLVRLGLRATPGIAARVGGVDRRRRLPVPAPRPLSSRTHDRAADADVVLWVDTFTNRFSPQVGDAAVQVLEAAGARVRVVADGSQCCGLTLVSAGRLDEARATLGRLVDTLGAHNPEGLPVVVLEPSCLAVLRHDAQHLLEEHRVPDLPPLRTLAEHLADLGWTPPRLDGVQVVAQPHCHQASVIGWQADEALLRATGAELTRVGGCCGLAGDFGMVPEHYDVSVKVFEHDLGPALEQHPEALLWADGFSCRTQAADLRGRTGLHLAEILQRAASSTVGVASAPAGGTDFDPPHGTR